MITSDKMSTSEKKRGISDVEDPKTPPHKKQKSESMGKLIDELNETVRQLKEVEYIHQLIIKGYSLVENVGNVQFTTHLRRDPKLIEDLKEDKTSIMQEIKSLEIDELCEEVNDSPKDLIRSQEDLISEEELTSTFYKTEYKSEKNHEDLKDMIKTLEHLEELEEQLEEQSRLKYLAESMALAEVSKDSLEGLEGLEGMMGTLAGSTAQRSLYPTKSNGRQEILTMIPKKREENEMRRGIEMMRGEILEYIRTMHLEQELQELPELDDEYTMPESLDTHDFSCLDTCDKLYGDDLNALRYFHENPVENLEDKLIQEQAKELQKLRELREKLKKMDESKSGKLMLRL